MADKIVGILGIGNIGKKVARRVQAFDARVQYSDMFPMSEEQDRELDVVRVEIDELFRTSDIITCHTPLTKETHHIVNAEMLAPGVEGCPSGASLRRQGPVLRYVPNV